MRRYNQRRHPRIQTHGLGAKLLGGDLNASFGLVENISAGGVFVRTQHELQPGDSVVLNLDPEGTRSLRLTGRVVGRDPPDATNPGTHTGLRIQFDPMEAEQSEKLKELLRALGDPSPEAPPLMPAFTDKEDQVRWIRVPSPKQLTARAPALTEGTASSKIVTDPELRRLKAQVDMIRHQFKTVQAMVEERDKEIENLKRELTKARAEAAAARRMLERAKKGS